MDETHVYIDMPNYRTMHQVDDKTIYMATSCHEKTRFTVTITVYADCRVWPAYMILRGLKKIQRVNHQSNVNLAVAKSESLEWHLMLDYIQIVLKLFGTPPPRLIIMDD